MYYCKLTSVQMETSDKIHDNETCLISVITSFTVKTDSVNNEAIQGEKHHNFKKKFYIWTVLEIFIIQDHLLMFGGVVLEDK